MLTAEHILENKGGKIISVEIESTVADALKIMLENKIGAILITEGEEIKGIWTREGFDEKCCHRRLLFKNDTN